MFLFIIFQKKYINKQLLKINDEKMAFGMVNGSKMLLIIMEFYKFLIINQILTKKGENNWLWGHFFFPPFCFFSAHKT